MRGTLFAVIAACAWSTWALADPAPSGADALKQSYAAYKEALAKNDLPAAEAAAERAWRAAEDVKASNDQIAALAFNLTQTRLDQARYKEAIEPAKRTYDLGIGGAKTVDPIAAQLMLGEALTGKSVFDAEAQINQAIQSAGVKAGDYRAYIYSASRALARAAIGAERWRISLNAWAVTFDHVNPAGAYADAWRGEALTGRGIALTYLEEDKAAAEALLQAVNLLVPFAAESDRDEVSIAETLYANAVGWRLAVNARIMSSAGRSPDLPTPNPRKSLPNLPPLCDFGVTPVPKLVYPMSSSGSSIGFGGAVLRLWMDENGVVISHKVLATLPHNGFAAAFNRPNQKYEAFLLPTSQAGCRRATKDRLQNVIFGIR